MKYLKTYNQLNEGLRDMMKPKSDEDVEKALSKLNPYDRFVFVKEHDLDDKFMPPNEELKNHIKDLDFFTKLRLIGEVSEFKNLFTSKEIEEFFDSYDTCDRIKISKGYKIDHLYFPTDKEVEECLNDLSLGDHLFIIKNYNLDDKFYPTDEKILKSLKDLNLKDKVFSLKKLHNKDKRFLPSIQEVKDSNEDKKVYMDLLKVAIDFNDFELAEFLLDEYRLNINFIFSPFGFDTQLSSSYNLLHNAFINMDKEAFEFLLKNGADPHLIYNNYDSIYSTIKRHVRDEHKHKGFYKELLKLIDKYE